MDSSSSSLKYSENTSVNLCRYSMMDAAFVFFLVIANTIKDP